MNINDTRKTQEIAEERKLLGSARAEPPVDDDAAVEQYLTSKGYAKQDTVESIVEQKIKGLTKAQQDEKTIQSVITANPELKQFEGVIKKLATLEPTKAIEDIVAENGFSTHDKLSKAKERDIRGGSTSVESNSKSITEMSNAEWEAYKAKNQRVSSFR